MLKMMFPILIFILIYNTSGITQSYFFEKGAGQKKPKKEKKKHSKNKSETSNLFMFEKHKDLTVADSTAQESTPKTSEFIQNSEPSKSENPLPNAIDNYFLNPVSEEDKLYVQPKNENISNTNDYIIAQKEETIYSIGRKYQISVADLILFNNLSSTSIKEGQKIYLKEKDKLYAQPKNEAISNTNDYIITQKEETIYSIGRKYQISVADLILFNNLSSTNIKEGQKIYLSPNITSNNRNEGILQSDEYVQKTVENKLPSDVSNFNKIPPKTLLIGCHATATKKHAAILANQLKQRGYTADYFYIPDYEEEGKKMYRVFIGPFSDKESAKLVLAEVQKFRKEAYLFKVK